MKILCIEPSALEGQIRIPPSKSISHRALICAGLAAGVSRIRNLVVSQDIAATLQGMEALGAIVRSEQEDKEIRTGASNSVIEIEGSPVPNLVRDTIDCRESGSTLRFLIPLAARSGEKVTFLGQGKLGERPLDAYYKLFEEQGIKYSTTGGLLPLTIEGSLRPGTFHLQGNVSSQFISGLLFLLPLLEGDSKLIVTTELESRGYVDLTIDVLQKFGIEIKNREYREFSIKGEQRYQPCQYRVEGDYSQAAFWIAAGVLGGRIECLDLNPESLQGDKAILDIVGEMGAVIEVSNERMKIKANPTKGIQIDARQCPDLVPVLAALAALSVGTTRIVNAERLRIKESDRLKAMATELNKLGAQVKETADGLIIEGVESLQGGIVDSWNDHRIAMALAAAALKCREPLYLTGFEAVNKSYPQFWRDYEKLGGKCYERSMG